MGRVVGRVGTVKARIQRFNGAAVMPKVALDQSSVCLSHTRVPASPPAVPVVQLSVSSESGELLSRPRQPARTLREILRRIDGWGEHGWRQIHGTWQLPHAVLVLEPREHDGDPLATLMIPKPVQAKDSASDRAAVCDWALRRLLSQCPSGHANAAAVRYATSVPGPAVVASTAAFVDGDWLCLRLIVRLPFAGLCCDGSRFARFVRRLDHFAKGLHADVELRKLRRAVAIQEALRAALPAHGLIAFLGTGSRLARAADGAAVPQGQPLRVANSLAVTIDLGALGCWRGIGIRRGITAIVGAAYHGKSTFLQAIVGGRDNHRPGDGRETVVCISQSLAVQAEEGRRISNQDMRPFFPRLPGSPGPRFTTEQASGATSMAASTLQGIAAGAKVLLIDEDTAAGNFLWLDPAMRRLLGRAAAAGCTLTDRLQALAKGGISTIVAVGSATPVLTHADRVICLDHFQPREVTARARRVAAKISTATMLSAPSRTLHGAPEWLLEERHFLRVDCRIPDQPVILRQRDRIALDLRCCGFRLNEELSRGALTAAAWCLRLTAGRPTSMLELAQCYQEWTASGARTLDPFATTMLTLPPWLLVACILERLPGLTWVTNRS